MAEKKNKKLLIITDNYYVSAVLFHGFGLSPWYDLPEIQRKPAYRRIMTDKLNKVISLGTKAGYNNFEVHESFPVDLMRISENALIIRGVDRFLIRRNYSGFALLRERFKGLKPQPRLRLIRKMTLGNKPIDETDIIVLYFNEKSIPLVYSEIEVKKYALKKYGKFTENLIVKDRIPKFPQEFIIEFGKDVPLKTAQNYPGVIKIEKNSFYAKPLTAAKLLELYKYAGLLVQAARKY